MSEKEKMLSGIYLAHDVHLRKEHRRALRPTRLFNQTTENETAVSIINAFLELRDDAQSARLMRFFRSATADTARVIAFWE